MAHNFIIAFPQDGTRKRDVTKGILHIDFWEGVVTLPDGTQTTLTTNLKNSDQQFIRSLVVYCTQGMKIRLGINNPISTFSDQCNWNVYENLAIREVTFETSFTGTPDENEFQVLASTSNKSLYKPLVVKIHQAKAVSGQTTTDSYATLFENHTNAFDHQTYSIEETGSANGITYKIEVKQSSSGTYLELQGDTTVSAGGNDIVQIEGCFHFVKISIKATSGGNQGTVSGQWLGQG